MLFQYQRTQHGGHSGGKGDKGSTQSVLKPIARWLQRRTFFFCGGLDWLGKNGWMGAERYFLCYKQPGICRRHTRPLDIAILMLN
jgi:hypothetical protein